MYSQDTLNGKAIPSQDTEIHAQLLKLEHENQELKERLRNVETIITADEFQVLLPSAEDEVDRNIKELLAKKEHLKRLKK